MRGITGVIMLIGGFASLVVWWSLEARRVILETSEGVSNDTHGWLPVMEEGRSCIAHAFGTESGI